MIGWKTIDVAPRDGSPIWAYNNEQGVMRWISGDGYALWVWVDELLSEVDPDPTQPTHWRSLPEPPK